jgi:indolepyruvate ferredoxin oxidoreductase beta subunit
VKADVVLAGVGGQGVLSVAAILAEAARRDGLAVKQGEIHGMSQRGGAVQATLRISDHQIESDLIMRGGADLIVGLEPLESLRYVDYLAVGGTLLTASDPLENIPDYPPLDEVHARVRRVPGSVIVDARALAVEAGSPRAANVVMVGAAGIFLPLSPQILEGAVRDGFARKGRRVAEVNLRALAAGRDAVAPAPA